MSAKRLVLWRHGQTDYNLNGQVQGQVDIALNETGIAQAHQAAAALQEAHPTTIITSDLSRAHDTAQALADLVGCDVQIDKRLRERAFGVFEGLTAKEMKARYPAEFDQWRATGECAAAGIESRVSVGTRVAQAMKDYAEQVADDATIVFTSHGSSLTQGIVAMLGLDPLQWQGIRGLDNCHWSILIPHNREPWWRISAHNLGADFTGFSPVLKRAINQ